MSPDAIDAAIDHLENALSDLRWASRRGNPTRSECVPRARNQMLQAEDQLDRYMSQLIAEEEAREAAAANGQFGVGA